MNFSIDFDFLPPDKTGLIIGFGVFDGVHLGHQLIIRKVTELAEQCGGAAAAVTFLPHPRSVVDPANAPELIISPESRIRKLHEAGAECVGVIDFTRKFAAMAPEAFLDTLLGRRNFALKGICIGEDWRFGCHGGGDVNMLEEFAGKHGILFSALPRLYLNGENISSSAVRQGLSAGEIEKSRAMLGYWPELSGTVVYGNCVAGKELSAPTANIDPDSSILVPDGVYAGMAEVDSAVWAAVLNIGVAPTFKVGKRRVEVHLLGYSGDLYGKKLTVKLLRFLRNERKFAGAAELKDQICCDIKNAEKIFFQEVKKK